MPLYSFSEIFLIAKWQKFLLWSVVVSIASFFLIYPEDNTTSGVLIHAAMTLVEVVLYIIPICVVYKMLLTLRMESRILWMIGMFVPGVSLVVLLLLNNRATKAIRTAGFHVGLMGADIKEIEAKMVHESTGYTDTICIRLYKNIQTGLACFLSRVFSGRRLKYCGV